MFFICLVILQLTYANNCMVYFFKLALINIKFTVIQLSINNLKLVTAYFKKLTSCSGKLLSNVHILQTIL